MDRLEHELRTKDMLDTQRKARKVADLCGRRRN